MNNEGRGKTLVWNGIVYLAIAFYILIFALINSSSTLLNIAVINFGIFTVSLLLSSIYFEAGEDVMVSKVIIVISTIVMIPLSLIAFVLLCIIDIIEFIFFKKRGGESYYDE